MNINRKETIFSNTNITLMIIILVGAFLRFYGIGFEDLWLDEARTVWFGSKSYDLITAIKRISTDLQGPLYFIFIHFWLYFVDISETSMRIPSAFFGILSIFFIYRLGSNLFNKNVGLYSGLILTFSNVHFYQSQEARTYTLTVLLAILSYYYLVKFIQDKKIYNVFLYVFFSTALIYSHYYTIFIIAAQNLFFLISYKQKIINISLKYWIKINFIIFLLLIPAVFFFLKYQMHRQRLERGNEFNFDVLTNILIYISGNSSLLIIFLLLAIFALTGNLFNIRKLKNDIVYTTKITRSKTNLNLNKVLLLTWFITPIVIPILIALLYKSTFFRKYFLVASIALYVLAAIGIEELKYNILKIIFISLIIFYGTSSILNSYEYYEKPRWKDLAEEIDSNYSNGDLVIIYPSFHANVFNYYSESGYLQKKFKYSRENHLINQLRINQREESLSNKELQNISSKNKVWLILMKADSKSKLLKKTLLKNYKLQSINKFSDHKYAEALLYTKDNTSKND